MAQQFDSITVPLDFLSGIKEITTFTSNCLIIYNAPPSGAYHSQLLAILLARGFSVQKSCEGAGNVIFSGIEGENKGNNFHYVRLTSMEHFSLRPSLNSTHTFKPFTTLIRDATFTRTKMGKETFFASPLAVTIGPLNFFKKNSDPSMQFKPGFYTSLPPHSSKRRNDALIT